MLAAQPQLGDDEVGADPGGGADGGGLVGDLQDLPAGELEEGGHAVAGSGGVVDDEGGQHLMAPEGAVSAVQP